MKYCPSCKKYLSSEDFSVNNSRFDGLTAFCKSCNKEYHKKYYKNNKIKWDKPYDPELNKKRCKQYQENNKDKIRLSRKIWMDSHKELKKQRDKEYYQKNKNKIKTNVKNYRKNRYKIDEEFRLLLSLRRRLNRALKMQNAKKQNKTSDLIGCTFKELKNYLENLFKDNMTWNNHGRGFDKWNIDHIRPCASFNLIDPDQQKQCFHYTNLQPMWENDNLHKNSLYNDILYRKNNKFIVT